MIEEIINAEALLVNLSGVQKESTKNKLNDSQLLFLTGICVSQGIPVKIFQSNKNFYSDIEELSIMDNSGELIIEYLGSVCK